VALPISKETILMGSDIGNSNTAFLKGNNFAVNVTVDSVKEADRLFKHLSSGGHVVMPMNTMIWGDYLGKFIDQFGVQWIIIYEPK
jgi:PhnB protein